MEKSDTVNLSSMHFFHTSLRPILDTGACPTGGSSSSSVNSIDACCISKTRASQSNHTDAVEPSVSIRYWSKCSISFERGATSGNLNRTSALFAYVQILQIKCLVNDFTLNPKSACLHLPRRLDTRFAALLFFATAIVDRINMSLKSC